MAIRRSTKLYAYSRACASRLPGKTKMKKTLLRKSIAAAILLLVLAFSTTAINIPLVKADVGGIGKFLTIEINSEGAGSVTATKVKSGETWNFTWADPPMTEKVGAGTVELEAFPSEGWKFSHWEGDLYGNSDNPTEYQTKKHGNVVAVFIKTFTITAIVALEAPNGYIETIVDGNTIQITDQLDVTVEYGDSQTFDFYPESGYQVSAIKIDSDFIDPTQPSYTFTNVQENWTIVVFFSADGEAYVPAGTNVPLYLGGSVSLLIESTEGGGIATQEDLLIKYPLLVGTSLILWNVSIGVSFDGIVEIALPYLGIETIQNVYHGDLDELLCDVNGDGRVDGDDVSDVANAVKSYTGHGLYDANCDPDMDGDNDEDDIHRVNEYKGTLLQSLNFWVEGNTLYIETEMNRVFRGR